MAIIRFDSRFPVLVDLYQLYIDSQLPAMGADRLFVACTRHRSSDDHQTLQACIEKQNKTKKKYIHTCNNQNA